MDLSFKVSARIAKPVAEVFEAVVNPDHLSRYFTTGGAKGRIETGATVYWDFHDFPGAFPVHVMEVEPERRIVLRWAATDCAAEAGDVQAGEAQSGSYDTTVTMTFEPLDGGTRTLVSIAEAGWRQTPEGLQASYGNCQGWMQMACAMKAWLEHGINLREGMFK
ncbi:SRPBCC family protein [Pedomonas mirosovicensis]|uniref:SRPBCC family protein n=1 Tax=Pedomonas mirosovicensis TaxID=2908641 RepID=UPI0021673ADA|nr:SRPBCC family protein [Pedomonas mirosovicensis]MCH8686076.1 SRPBCC family protein [Pedomonas mirosovicensis]